jgi:formylglycine-generating enzyme required for sulfatase activity
MANPNLAVFATKMPVYLLLVFAFTVGAVCPEEKGDEIPPNMVFVEGGTFMMGDVFGDGEENERPVHDVTLSGFYISTYEVTVGEFKKFVQETGYKTSAEAPANPDAGKKMMERATSGELTPEEIKELKKEMLLMGGAGYWDAEKRQWTGYNPNTNWRNPGFEQTDDDPVVAVSVDDAMHYCNWLSLKAGLPVAYNPETGDLLDKDGDPTLDITVVRGYRLPTEAEWEYAAREGGNKVRFGNGKNIAKSSEINFLADQGEYEYLELGEYRMGTIPVGSFPPNSLGLYDMSGNAWEWAGGGYARYGGEPQVNPCTADSDKHALRGGRWGGDAFEARVFHRSGWVRNDRCNNSGFRVARSAD